MNASVIDVNVAIVANGRSIHADDMCELACIQALKQAREGLICIDDRDAIMAEYRKNLSLSGQPGVGDEFMEWLHQNQHTENVCERVDIHPDVDWGFVEFPHDDELGRITDSQRFDPSDRKYVAVALASKNSPDILNAVDSDWRQFGNAWSRHGIHVRELCPHCLRSFRS